MNAILHIAVIGGLLTTLGGWPPHAQAEENVADIASIEPGTPNGGYHDLVFGVADASSQKPFYADSTFMLGNKLIKVEQGAVPDHKLVAFDAKTNRVIVSDDKTIAEADKGAAVLQLMDAMAIERIEPAAGP